MRRRDTATDEGAPSGRALTKTPSRLGVAAVVLLGLACGRGSEDDTYVVGRNETRQETLVVAANAVRIDGSVEGDVVAIARRVEVNGEIEGNLVVLAERAEIDVGGIVEGGVQCACNRIEVRGEVRGNAYALAESAVLSATGDVHGDVLVSAANARVDGRVGRDLLLRARDVDLGGRVERDVRGRAARLGVSAPARIGGDVRVDVSDVSASAVADEAVVGGTTVIDEIREVSRFAKPGWYALQVVQLLAAFLVGLVLARVYPPLFTAPVGKGRRLVLDLGLGLLVLVVTPLAAVIVACTVIGLPLGLIGLGLWVIALYLAGIIVAGRLGNALVRRHLSTSVLGLFVGLLVLGILSELPWVGPLIAVIATLVGFAIAVDVARERRL